VRVRVRVRVRRALGISVTRVEFGLLAPQRQIGGSYGRMKNGCSTAGQHGDQASCVIVCGHEHSR
jgi:hypothetical protein